MLVTQRIAAEKITCPKPETDYVKDFIGSHTWEISKSEFKNAKDIDQTFKEIHDITINDHTTTAGDVIYLNPFITMQEVRKSI